MRRLWTMLAWSNARLWNASELASSLGISYHTVNRYVDILEQTFLVRRLAPYFANVGKRLVKSPKVYFRDTGLLHYFLGIHSRRLLEAHPARGGSWEAFVIDQLISAFGRCVPGAQTFFYRTAQGDEVDLLVEAAGRLVAVEVKLHTAPGRKETLGLRRCMTQLKLARGYLVHSGRQDYSLGGGVRALSAARLLGSVERVGEL
jgi:hypothetical protein